MGSWAVEIYHTVCLKWHKTTTEKTENNCRSYKRQLQTNHKTIAEFVKTYTHTNTHTPQRNYAF